MRINLRFLLAVGLVVLSSTLLSACGGSGSSANSEVAAAEAAVRESETEGLYAGPRTPNASKEFIVPGADNSIPNYGTEASAAEREAASIALESYLVAREEADWRAACKYIAPEEVVALKKLAVRSATVDGDKCAGILGIMFELTSAESRKSTMIEPIGGLRVNDVGNSGFALYHGRNEIDYAIPMSRSQNPNYTGWQVSALEPTELPR